MGGSSVTPTSSTHGSDKRLERAARAAAEKARAEREKDPALMAAYQEKKRKEEEARLKRKEREEEKKTEEYYDKWKAESPTASRQATQPHLTFQDSLTASGQGWLWVFFGLSGRLEQRRYFIATVFSWILFIASLHYVLSTDCYLPHARFFVYPSKICALQRQFRPLLLSVPLNP